VALTGTPTAPTPTLGDNTTKIATTAFVQETASADTPQATFTTSGIVKQTVYNVMDYGAVGDGTTDDSTAINNAIAAANAAGGGVVQLAAKHYISTSIIPASNVWIRGFGVNATTIYPSTANTGGSGDAIRLVVSSTPYDFRVRISDLTIDCSAQYPTGQFGSTPATYSNGITLQGIDDVLVENVKVIKPFGYGIIVSSVTSGGFSAPYVKRPILKNIFIEGERGGYDSVGGGGIFNGLIDGLYVYPASDGTNPYGTATNWTNLTGVTIRNLRTWTTFVYGMYASTTPAVPPVATPLFNPYAFPVTITVTGTLTAVTINGVSAGTGGTYTLPGFGQISMSYPSSPTWVWSVPTAPAVPASTVAATNSFAFPVPVTITGGTVSAVVINGVTQGTTSGYFLVPVAGTISITYTSAPTWSWATSGTAGAIETDFGAVNTQYENIYINGFQNGFLISKPVNRQYPTDVNISKATIINVGYDAVKTNVYTGYGISGITVRESYIDKWGMLGAGAGIGLNGVTDFVLESNTYYGSIAFNDMRQTPSYTISTSGAGSNIQYWDNKGYTSTTGTGNVVLANSPTLITPALDTPSAIVLTNATGTASSLTSGNVITNANLTGPITSSGNTTSVAAQTGTGSTFVMNTAPTISNPVIANIAPGANFTLTQNSVAVLTSVNSGAVVNTLYLSTGKVGVNTSSPNDILQVSGGDLTTFKNSTNGTLMLFGTAATGNVYVALDFGQTQASTTKPIARIAATQTGSGSELYFGTSNSYASGVTNTALIIDYNGNSTFGGSLITKASATGATGFNFPSGTAPTTPYAGDTWYDGTNLNFYNGSATQTFVDKSTTQTVAGNKTFSGSNAYGTPASIVLTNATGLPISGISTTGTASSTTYLRGDGAWATVSGGSGITRSINSISTATSAGSSATTDYVYFCTATLTLTLPTAASNTNLYTINNTSASGTITVATTSSQTINGSTTVTIAAGSSLDLVSNGSNWYVV
jgi:hypothetical protein